MIAIARRIVISDGDVCCVWTVGFGGDAVDNQMRELGMRMADTWQIWMFDCITQLLDAGDIGMALRFKTLAGLPETAPVCSIYFEFDHFEFQSVYESDTTNLPVAGEFNPIMFDVWLVGMFMPTLN